MGVVLKTQLKRVFLYLVLVVAILGFLYVSAESAHAATIIRPPNNLGLVGYWSFDEGRGTRAGDMSGNGNSGVLNGGPTWVNGKSRGALAFDGVDDFVNAGNGTSLNITDAITVSAWVKIPINTGNRGLLDKGYSNSVGYYTYVGSGGAISLALRIGGAWREKYSETTFADGEWHLFTAVYDGSVIRIYRDGQPDGVLTGVSGSIASSSSYELRIGFLNAANRYFKDLIDEVRIYNRALSASEVLSLYSNTKSTTVGVTPTDRYNNGLVAHWTFDGKHTTAITALDGAGDNHGTISGAVPTRGIIGQAMEFDGFNDSITVPSNSAFNSFGTTPFSVSAWVKTTSTSFTSIIDNKTAGTNNPGYNIQIAETNGEAYFRVANGTAQSHSGHSTTKITDGEWHHLVGTRDSSGLKLYVDGILENQNPNCGSCNVSGSQNLLFGTYGSGGFLDGFIDDVRIYNRALSASEVAGLYSATSSSKMTSSTNALVTSGLVGHWSFDASTVSGSSVSDVSGNQSAATIVGNTSTAAGKIEEAFSFDGDGDYVVLPTISNARSLSLWVYIDSGQIGWKYLLDARTGLVNGWFASGGIGSDWTTLYVNGTPQTVNWANIPQDQWVHLYIESNTTFTDNINLMSRYSNNENLAGMLDDFRIYNRALSEAEITQLYSMGQ